MNKILIYLLLCLVTVSCERKTDWPMKGDLDSFIVVDGLLTNEPISHSIKLTYPVKTLNEIPAPVTNATVIISSDESLVTLTEMPTGSGIYVVGPSFFARLNHVYTLNIYLGSKVYSAKSAMVPGAAFKSIKYVKNANNRFFHIEWVANPYHAIKPAMWEVYLDWSKVAGFQHLPADSCKVRLLYYTLPTLDVSQVFAPEMERINFPAGTKIVEKRYSLSPAHAEFIRSMLLETNWQGGLFSSTPANVSTNLSEGAVGFFGVCAVNADSLFIH